MEDLKGIFLNESSVLKEMARSVGGSRELFQGLLSLAANEKQKGTTKLSFFFVLCCKFHFITYLQTRVLKVSDFSPVT
jgi:hypothetical protein